MKNIHTVENENCVIVSVNTKIYPLDVIYSASYVFLDRAYILLDGEPNKVVTVRMVPKEGYDLKKMGMEFNNELLNYSLYKRQSEKNAAIRQAIIQRAIITGETASDIGLNIPEFKESDADYLEDPEGIAVPWEEKSRKEKSHENKESAESLENPDEIAIPWEEKFEKEKSSKGSKRK